MEKGTAEKCDHDPCHCKVRSDNLVRRGKLTFCSPGCADGKGCTSDECGCAHAENASPE